jgi:multiple sugar transport system permease protein
MSLTAGTSSGATAETTSPDRGQTPRSGDGPRPTRHVDPTRRQQAIAAWLLALPFVLLFLAFTLGPVLASLGMAFTDMKRTDIRTPLAVQFVGLDNFTHLIKDPLFLKVTLNTLLYLLLGVPLTMAIALAVAVWLNRVNRLKGFFRVGYYLPAVTSIVAVSVVWKFLYRDNGGLFNTVLSWVGIDGPGWLDSTTLALPSLVLMAAWRNFGGLMVIFLAGLQTIPKEINEAAEVDGASGWRRFRYITLPMLRPVLLFGAVITGIGYLQFFEEAFVMTKGGPLDATKSVTYYTYDQFGFGNFGYAAAASYLLFIAIVALTFFQFRLLGERPDKPAKPKRTKKGQEVSSR